MNVQLICHVQTKDIERLSAFFFDHGCLGTEIIEKTEKPKDYLGEIYQLNKNDYPQVGSQIIGYFTDIDSFLDEFNYFVEMKNIEFLEPFKYKILEDRDYDTEFRKSFSEIKITESLSIVPPWYEINNSHKIVVRIEPGMGFGTGQHPTTRLSILALIENLEAGDKVLDIGTGSGILAIIAKNYGASEVTAVDLDSDALKNAHTNARLNQTEIHFLNQPLSRLDAIYDIIIANIVYQTLVEMLSEVNLHLCKDGKFILSGLLDDEVNKMIDYLNYNQFKLIKKLDMEGWVTLITKKIG